MPVVLMAGLAALLVGTGLFFAWLGDILALVRAMIPLGLIVAGAVAVYLGWEEFQDFKKPPMDFSSPDEAGRYQAEARAYQDELNELSRRKEGSPPA